MAEGKLRRRLVRIGHLLRGEEEKDLHKEGNTGIVRLKSVTFRHRGRREGLHIWGPHPQRVVLGFERASR